MATATPTADRPHRAAKRYIYAWGDGRAEGNAQMRDLLGGKGAGLAEMTIAGLPTPPGFTITTEACNDYFAAGERLPDGLWDDVLEAVREVERSTGKGFGDAANPLLVSVRSGREVLDARDDGHRPQPRAQRADPPRPHRPDRQRALRLGRLPAVHPDVRPDRHGGRRAIGSTTRSRPPRRPMARSQDTELDAAALQALVAEFKAIVKADTGRDFPEDPDEQLDLAIKAVFASWFGKRAHGLPQEPGDRRRPRARP